jgi:predicted RNA-binding protein with PUA-like domain
MNYWLVKQEPADYAWGTFVSEKGTVWTGVRSFPARKNLRAMKKNDLVFYYHSGEEKRVVGLARVRATAYPDPTAPGEDWDSVDLAPVKPLTQPVTLSQIKAHPALRGLALVRQPRLSVLPVSAPEFAVLLQLAGTRGIP